VLEEFAKVDGMESQVLTDTAFVRTTSPITIMLTGPVMHLKLCYELYLKDSDSKPKTVLRGENDLVVNQDFRQDYDHFHGASSDYIQDGTGFRPDYNICEEGPDQIPSDTPFVCLRMARVIFIGHDPFGRESLEYSLVLCGMRNQECISARGNASTTLDVGYYLLGK
jgi:hypothetical protein